MNTAPVGQRHGTHYETLPHDNCPDPHRCDCFCDACWEEKTRCGRCRMALPPRLMRGGLGEMITTCRNCGYGMCVEMRHHPSESSTPEGGER